MLFNSIEFLIFLPIAFVCYWFVFGRTIRARNLFLLVISYVFYGWWDWRFLSLLILSSSVDYLLGIAMGRMPEKSKRKRLLLVSLLVNLGMLGIFKYFNFFQREFIDLFASWGVELNPWSLQIVLPVGISFYTFQTLSYTIDVYRGNLKPCKDVVAFFAFVSFFPQLVAGPIERATNLIPQFYQKARFDLIQAKDGLRQMLWGFFKKVVVADNCAILVQQIFENYETADSVTLAYGAVLFAFQIYGDFSGYSDIAIGCARLLGFDLMRNFAYPYFSRDIAEFWRRWHISLSTWFRDYLYIPLGGSKGNKISQFRNVLAIFLVSGFWHGANWTFIMWGLINALLFLPLMFANTNRKNMDVVANDQAYPTLREVISIGLTFAVTCIAWVFFRAESVTQAFGYLGHMFDPSNVTLSMPAGLFTLVFIGILLVFEWVQRRKQHALEIKKLALPFRWGIYYGLIYLVFYYKPSVPTDFIYFQF